MPATGVGEVSMPQDTTCRGHLRQVDSPLLEFEAVLGPGVDDATGQSQLDHLAREFSLDRGDLLSGSYSDMVTQRSVS